MTTGILARKCEALTSFNFSLDVVVAFTEGDCWALAHEISSLTGWEVFAVGSIYDYNKAIIPSDRGWDHMFVRHPSGYLIDIEGVHTDKAMLDYWFRTDGIIFEASHVGHLEGAGDRQFPEFDITKYAHRVIWDAEEYFASMEFATHEGF